MLNLHYKDSTIILKSYQLGAEETKHTFVVSVSETAYVVEDVTNGKSVEVLVDTVAQYIIYIPYAVDYMSILANMRIASSSNTGNGASQGLEYDSTNNKVTIYSGGSVSNTSYYKHTATTTQIDVSEINSITLDIDLKANGKYPYGGATTYEFGIYDQNGINILYKSYSDLSLDNIVQTFNVSSITGIYFYLAYTGPGSWHGYAIFNSAIGA